VNVPQDSAAKLPGLCYLGWPSQDSERLDWNLAGWWGVGWASVFVLHTYFSLECGEVPSQVPQCLPEACSTDLLLVLVRVATSLGASSAASLNHPTQRGGGILSRDGSSLC
jgi:hypothetical protein